MKNEKVNKILEEISNTEKVFRTTRIFINSRLEKVINKLGKNEKLKELLENEKKLNNKMIKNSKTLIDILNQLLEILKNPKEDITYKKNLKEKIDEFKKQLSICFKTLSQSTIQYESVIKALAEQRKLDPKKGEPGYESSATYITKEKVNTSDEIKESSEYIAKPKDKKSLNSLLITSVQRGPRYDLLFREIIKKSKDENLTKEFNTLIKISQNMNKKSNIIKDLPLLTNKKTIKSIINKYKNKKRIIFSTKKAFSVIKKSAKKINKKLTKAEEI